MALQSLNEYQDKRYKNLLTLPNDGDSVDVIFLYQSINDVMIADAVHYIKSSDYTGYVHCCGRNCPACAKKIRVQGKLFIPVYEIESGKVKFWDRSIRFQNQLNQDVLSRYPNPSEAIFRITRHGISGDVNTSYEITPIAKNLPPKDDDGSFYKSYDMILAENHITFPEYYNEICKQYSSSELYNLLETSAADNNTNSYATGFSSMADYNVTPRGQSNQNQPISSENTDDDFMNIPEDEDDEVNF